MSSLAQEVNEKAVRLGIPLSVHLDVTYRCNERCVHCYLPSETRHSEMSTAQIGAFLQEFSKPGRHVDSIDRRGTVCP